MKSRPSIVILICLMFAAGSMTLYGQKVGTSSLQFLKVMPTARATAMGDAYSTLAQGSDAVFWNPAGIAGSSSIEVAGTFIVWLFDSRQSALSSVFPIGDWGIAGLQLQYVDYGDIPVTRADRLEFVGSGADYHYNPGLTGETFSPTSYVIGLSFARQLTDKFAAGITAKFVDESLWSESEVTVMNPSTGRAEVVNTFARMMLFDFGMQYNTGYRTIRLGVAIQNFGGQVKFAQEAYPAPLTFRIGTAADIVGQNALFAESELTRLTIAYDLFQPNDYAQQMHVGAEFTFNEAVYLRGGYKLFYDNDSFTAGFGVRQTVVEIPLGIDYSYGAMGDYLPSVHRISVGVKFK